jgi:hypothetical protein
VFVGQPGRWGGEGVLARRTRDQLSSPSTRSDGRSSGTKRGARGHAITDTRASSATVSTIVEPEALPTAAFEPLGPQ